MNSFLVQKIKFHSFIGSLICLAIIFGGYMIHINFNKNYLLILQIEKTLSDITYYDEVLTMSARMAAFTGNKMWEIRYSSHEKKLSEAIKLTYSIFPSDTGNIERKIIETANSKLVTMENKAFDLVKNGQFMEAQKVLMSPEYFEQKNLYALGQQYLSEKLEDHKKILNSRHLSMIVSIISACCLLIILSIISIFINIKTIQKSYDQERRSLEYKRLANIGKLSAGMAHEINNALQPILGLSEILYKTFTKNPEYGEFSEHTKIINHSAQHAKEIVENVLASAKGQQSQMTQWDAWELFTDSFSLSTQILPNTINTQMDFSAIKTPDDNYKILANKTDVTQTISNILKNASEAMDNVGTINSSIELVQLDQATYLKGDLQDGTYIKLIIEDTGRGIDKKIISSIFDPFFTTKSEQEGTGLGLSVAYGIMKQMGGDIQVVSKVNKGTTFTLFFPVQT